MATRKSKTIRANPLDAISAVSMEKVKAPTKNVPIKTILATSVAIKAPAPKTAPVKKVPVKSTRVKKIENSSSNDKKLSALTEEKILPIADTAPQIKAVRKKVKVSVASESKSGTVLPSSTKMASVHEDGSVQLGTASQQTNTESKSTKKCAEDIFSMELQEIPVVNNQSLESDKQSAQPGAKSVMPDLPPEAYDEVKNPKARVVIKQWAQWSAVGSMVPAPFMGTILISAAQIKMIHALCKSYGVPFQRNLAVAVATGLVGGGVTAGLAGLLGRIAIKTVPYVGAVFSIAVEPGLSYASSYAIGMSFVKHFEAGGNLEDFNVREMKSYFSEYVARCLAYFRDRKKSIFASKSAQ